MPYSPNFWEILFFPFSPAPEDNGGGGGRLRAGVQCTAIGTADTDRLV